MKPPTPFTARAFTLIELLVVISIIAVLAGLAFPAVNGALEAAKKAKAKSDVAQIVGAIKAYQTEYGKLPNVLSNKETFEADNNELFHVLRGVLEHSENPRKIPFIEPRLGKNLKDGLDYASGVFYDPWGKPYFIQLDLGSEPYDNQVTYYGIYYPGSAIAVSGGKNLTREDPNSGKDDICSFR
jgi:prepilin-type N-terminal cleavage/methylation domain-containing protein